MSRSTQVFLVGLLTLIAADAVHAQITGRGTDSSQGSAGALKSDEGAGTPPHVEMIGLPDKVRQEITAGYEAAKASPKDAARWGELGLLYAMPSPLDAATCFATAARLEPASFKWKYFEGLASAAGYRRDEAARAFREASRINPTYAPLYVHLGDVLMSSDAAAAEEAYRNALKHAPGMARAHFGLGECALRKGDKAAATRHFQEAVNAAPRFAAAHANLAVLMEEASEFRQAQIHRSRQQDGASPPPGDDPLLIEFYSRFSGGTQLLELAEGLAGEGRVDQAVSVLEQAISRNAADAQLHHALAVLCNKMGRYQQAVSHFREVLELAPAQMETLLHLSQTMLQIHDYSGAAGLLKEIIQNEPENHRALRLLAAAFLQLRKPDDAIPVIDTLMKLRPADAENHLLLALTALSQDRVGMAAQQYSEFRKKMPDPRAVVSSFAAHVAKLMVDQRRPSSQKLKGRRAITLNTIDRFAEALGSVDLAEDSPPFKSFADTLVHQASRLARQGDFSDAVLHLRAGIDDRREASVDEMLSRVKALMQAEPSEPAIPHLLALFLVSLDNLDAAGKQWRELLDAHPEYQVAAISWASELVRKGECGQAQRILRLSRKHNPDSVWLANSLAWSLAVDPAIDTAAAKEAVELATWACEKAASAEPAFLDTLATSYAAAGEFNKARDTMEAALQAAVASGKTESMAEYRKRMQMFRVGAAYKVDTLRE